eukprot:5976712-Heterocapsa_arctica.AAC.1
MDRVARAFAPRHGTRQISIISSNGPRLFDRNAIVIDQTHSAAATLSALELECLQELKDRTIAPIGAPSRPLDCHSSTVLDAFKRIVLELLPDLVEE